MRRFIDIINEFASDDNSGDDSGNQTILVYDILWDMDPEEEAKLQLPNRVTTTLHDVQEEADPYADEEYRDDLMHQIGQWLQNTYDWRLSTFNFRLI